MESERDQRTWPKFLVGAATTAGSIAAGYGIWTNRDAAKQAGEELVQTALASASGVRSTMTDKFIKVVHKLCPEAAPPSSAEAEVRRNISGHEPQQTTPIRTVPVRGRDDDDEVRRDFCGHYIYGHEPQQSASIRTKPVHGRDNDDDDAVINALELEIEARKRAKAAKVLEESKTSSFGNHEAAPRESTMHTVAAGQQLSAQVPSAEAQGQPRADATTAGADDPAALISHTIRVWWAGNKTWFTGKVVEFRKATADEGAAPAFEHKIIYDDDGLEKWHNLKTVQFCDDGGPENTPNWASIGHWAIGKRVRLSVKGSEVGATVFCFLREGAGDDEPALFKVRHDDNDVEDKELDELGL